MNRINPFTCSINTVIDVRPFFLRLSIISINLRFFLRLVRRPSCMALLTAPPPTTPSSPPPSPWWRRHKQEEAISSHQKKPAAAADGIEASRKRPARLVIPPSYGSLDFVERVKRKDSAVKEFEVIEGRDFFLARKKGRREVMEDRHAVVLDISGDSKQAFFVVIDGHGGDAAADYVAENLGKNIVNELEGVGKAGNDHIEAALRGGYLATDKQFLAQDANGGGACAAGVLLKNGEVHAANVGDCKAVLSRKGKAIPLTNDHRLSREDERARIENSGGFLYCGKNGIWRVNGSLAVTRAFGDVHLKDWIISEPEIVRLPLTRDCHFLILASDGLWDKVSDQEAVDVVSSDDNLQESCRKLVDMSSSRGSRDDITVMMVNLDNFKINIT